jgi:hypothetical protein
MIVQWQGRPQVHRHLGQPDLRGCQDLRLCQNGHSGLNIVWVARLASIRTTQPGAYEIVCPRCGDDGGPVHEQPDYIRRLRGPHGTEDEAWASANGHNLLHLMELL